MSTFALVRNFQNKGVVVQQQADGGGWTAGMAVDVGERLLQDTKDGELNVRRQATKSWGNFKSSPDTAAFGKSIEIPGNGRVQPHFFEHGRIKQIRYSANFLYGIFGDLRAVVQLLKMIGLQLGWSGSQAVQLHLQ